MTGLTGCCEPPPPSPGRCWSDNLTKIRVNEQKAPIVANPVLEDCCTRLLVRGVLRASPICRFLVDHHDRFGAPSSTIRLALTCGPVTSSSQPHMSIGSVSGGSDTFEELDVCVRCTHCNGKCSVGVTSTGVPFSQKNAERLLRWVAQLIVQP